MSNLDGSGRRLLYQSSSIHPFGLALTNNDLYWTDWTRPTIYRLSLLNTSNIIAIRDMADQVFGIAFVGQSRREGTPIVSNLVVLRITVASGFVLGNNSCSINNGGCEQLCLPEPSGFVCACGVGQL